MMDQETGKIRYTFAISNDARRLLQFLPYLLRWSFFPHRTATTKTLSLCPRSGVLLENLAGPFFENTLVVGGLLARRPPRDLGYYALAIDPSNIDG